MEINKEKKKKKKEKRNNRASLEVHSRKGIGKETLNRGKLAFYANQDETAQ